LAATVAILGIILEMRGFTNFFISVTYFAENLNCW